MTASKNAPRMRNLGNREMGKRRKPSWQPGRNLLIVIGLTCLAVSTSLFLNQWSRNWLICQQVERVYQAADDQVEVRIGQLASFGLPAIDALVAIAATAQAVPAAAARDVVNERVVAWLIQSRELLTRVPVDRQSTFTSLRLARLVEALVRHVNSMDATGRRWAERLTLQVLLHADRIPPEQSVQVLADCQAVLAAVPPHGSRLRDSDHPASVSGQALLFGLPPQQVQVGQEFMRAPSQKDTFEKGQAAPKIPLQTSFARPTLDWRLFATTPPVDLRSLEQLEEDHSFQPGNSSQNLEKPSGRMDNPLQRPAQARSPLALEPQGSAPIMALPLGTNRSKASAEYVLDVPTPAEMAAHRTQYQALPLRDLIMQLGRAHDFEAASIRTVARIRGLSDAELALAPWLASSQEAKRLELLQHLSQLPAREMRRWLRWLMEDADGEVRLRALTMMATTGDPQLEELARRRVMEDTDLRVVSLATRIIERGARR